MLRHVVSLKLAEISEVLTSSIIRAMGALMMEAVSTSETPVNLYETTWRKVPEEKSFSYFTTLRT
jgi:hypothetical protein